MKYSAASKKDFNSWAEMALFIWPRAKKKELKKEFENFLSSPKYKTFICKNERGEAVAFVDIAIRSDYVEGSTTKPVGYIEGIYVKPGYRNKGVAKELIRLAEKWALKRGCKELGSDAELKILIAKSSTKN